MDGPQSAVHTRPSSDIPSTDQERRVTELDKTHPRYSGPVSKSPEEGDTCRICRGEGTLAEPLFYPCKCSGSIKFVHQECLMEWLSHSQKKHCELCKTSFRFTKLYDSSMPSHLPTVVFLRKAALHMIQALFTWLRGFIVAGVWLLWLPWSMRFVWWGLFWIGDGGWTRDFDKLRNGLEGEIALRPFIRSQPPSVPISAINHHQKATTYSRLSSMLANSTSTLLYSPVAVAKHISNLFKSTRGPVEGLSNTILPTVNSTGAQSTSPDHDSLLSYVEFFHDLTPNSTANKFIIDILEGLIITLAVVTASILVFLIREWVVQQPALNFGALADDGPQIDGEVGPAPEADDGETDAELPYQGSSAHDETPHIAREASQLVEDGDAEEIRIAETSLADVKRLVQQVRDKKIIFQAISDGDKAIAANDFKEAKRIVVRSYNILDAFRKASKSALDDEDTVTARSALEKLEVLHETIMYLPWKDEAERQDVTQIWDDFLGPAKQLLEQQEELKRMMQVGENQRESSVRRDSVDTRPTLGFHSDAASHSPGQPSVPERAYSSLATNIQRDLQKTTESVEANKLTLDPTVTSADKSAGSPSSTQSNGAWQIVDNSNSNPNCAVSEAETTEESEPLQKPKEETDHLSITFQDSNSNAQARTDEFKLIVGDLATDSKPSSTADDSSNSANPGASEDPLTDRSALYHGSTLPQTLPIPDSLHSHAPDLLNPIDLNGATEQEGSNSNPIDRSEAVDPEIVDDNLETASQETPVAKGSFLERLMEWIFDDPSLARTTARNPRDGNEEHVVRDLADEAPFIPFVDAQPQNRAAIGAEPPNRDLEDAAEPVEPGANPNDADAVEDAEDLEGVWELIGMQGPLTGVLQNAVFCAVFMAAAVTSAVWIPYLIGKLVLLFLANPGQVGVAIPLRVFSDGTNLTIDLVLFGICTTLFWLDFLFRGFLQPLAWLVPSLRSFTDSKRFGTTLVHVVESALSRISRVIGAIGGISQQSQTHSSPSSLVALRAVQIQLKTALNEVAGVFVACAHYAKEARSATASWQGVYQGVYRLFHLTLAFGIRIANKSVDAATRLLSAVRSGEFSLTIIHSAKPIVPEASVAGWTPIDRLIAIFTGYSFFALVAILYLRRGSPLSTSQQGKKVERIITEILQQSGGVLKVILIISIEMIMFPLYCGLLLDIAMLPLFQSNVQSRVEFTVSAPWTSAFIHWFLGTCYMFHFALFVSMCRKIFRSGVLYFIRDPDDPTFHPVRDVLDRSVSSQLRKIGFSALVYGALVIVCMGSVVWTVSLGVTNVFPVRWASNSPLLGFPIDLLLYNLFAPLALQFFRPSKGLQKLYESWFRFCATRLRLTAFLFEDEQGKDVARELSARNEKAQDGRFVRAPASDQVRIPKGHQVFLEVDEDNERIDGLEDKDNGVHGRSNPHFTTVWIPPWYRARIALFAIFIWVLTAFLGLSVTILPLLIGRTILTCSMHNANKINDVYAFAIGLLSVAAAAFLAFRLRQSRKHLELGEWNTASAASSAWRAIKTFAMQAFRVLYTYSSLVILVPTLIALLFEFYFIMPLHTYATISKTWAAQAPPTRPPDTHTVYFLQDCTLGLLYVRVFLRLLLWDPTSRPAIALHAIVANGWLNPNIRIATRCFILPITTATMLALCLPSALAYIASKILPWALAQLDQATLVRTGLSALRQTIDSLDPDALRIYMIRFSFPTFLFVVANVVAVFALLRAARHWRNRIRDEVYLIGERLHNFAERRPPTLAPQSRRVAGR